MKAPDADGYVHVCAWCERDLPPAERTRGENVTHGICPRHRDEVRAEIAAMKPKK